MSERFILLHDAQRAEERAERDNNRTANGASVSWGEPQAIRQALLPVAHFEEGMVPAVLGPWVMDIADRMQCPPDFVAVPAMIALATVIGRKIAIRPQERTDWYEVANLWGCIIGPPGSLKSPAIAEALKPLKRLEAKAREEGDEAKRRFALEMEGYEALKSERKRRAKLALKTGVRDDDGSLDGNEPEEPTDRRYITNDTTYERLGEILADNPNGVLVHRDELVSLLRTLDREEYVAARGFYLSAWNGKDGYDFDRIIRGRIHIEAACLSLVGSTQQGPISEYLYRAIKGGCGDDGLIQRFSLLVWPDHSGEWHEVDRYPDTQARTTAWKTFDRLNAATPEDLGAENDDYAPMPFLRFEPGARALFSEWRGDLEKRLRQDDLPQGLTSHLAKYRTLVPALTLINHLADGGSGRVSTRALKRALSFGRYLETHAGRAYASGVNVEAKTADAIAKRLRKGDLKDGFTLRDIRQAHWSSLADPEQIQGGLDLLTDLGWIRSETLPTGGRPRTVHHINPNIRK